ncbi:hypothetical protein CPS_3646 [Colwellia psychrerythraea 34H]|uniref:Uncharacterized protein n=1 Tax=Colwellia psychrerythraea (strain 34H / ATCC BAA-681) TaxID=167879 RepID=Q47Y06_COLP3|nr:hypothetical protein CPS_3646 [Colwellia psychrerythraea 34H]
MAKQGTCIRLSHIIILDFIFIIISVSFYRNFLSLVFLVTRVLYPCEQIKASFGINQ